MCIDAPESSTNSLPPVFLRIWLEKSNSVGDESVALSFSLSFRILLAFLHASSRAHRSSSLDQYSKITAQMGIFDFDPLQAMDLCFLRCLREEEWLLRIALVELLGSSVKTVTDSGGSMSCNTRLVVVHLSKKPPHFCHHPFSVFCWVDLQPACAVTSTHVTEFACRNFFVKLTFGRMPQITRLSRALNLCTAVELTSQMYFGL